MSPGHIKNSKEDVFIGVDDDEAVSAFEKNEDGSSSGVRILLL